MPLPSPRTSRALVAAALATASTTTLAACTAQQGAQQGSFSGTKKQVQNTITRLSDLADDRNAKAICSGLLTDDLGARLARRAGGDCARAVSAAIQHADYTQLTARAITLDGDGTDATATKAVARIQVVKDGPQQTIALVRNRSGKVPWLISGFAQGAPRTPAGTTPATPATTPR